MALNCSPEHEINTALNCLLVCIRRCPICLLNIIVFVCLKDRFSLFMKYPKYENPKFLIPLLGRFFFFKTIPKI